MQGTFSAYDKLSSLFYFVQDNLIEDLQFNLIQPGGDNLNSHDRNLTFSELKLVPSIILNFQMDNIPASILNGELSYLNPALLRDV